MVCDGGVMDKKNDKKRLPTKNGEKSFFVAGAGLEPATFGL